jgi:hypothetical protein
MCFNQQNESIQYTVTPFPLKLILFVCYYTVVVGDVADVLKVYASSIFRAEVCTDEFLRVYTR